MQYFIDNDVISSYNWSQIERGEILNERIKALRKQLDMTQSEFAQKIGTSQNVLANYEIGRRNPSNSVINNICKTFDVNEDWLRTGEGEMFIKLPEEDLFSKAAASCIKDNDSTAMEALILWRSLSPEARENVKNYIRQIFDVIKEQQQDKD